MARERLSIGSWSEGSTRSEDIAGAILDMAREVGIDYDDGIVISGETVFDTIARFLAHDDDEHDGEPCEGTTAGDHFRQCPLAEDFGLSDLLDEALDALNEYAPIYCYVGTHPGDGADFGVWPDHDAIEEAIRNGEQTPDGVVNVEDGVRIVVSDHGNVEVYALETGASLLAIV
jgi:hypothetical protein